MSDEGEGKVESFFIFIAIRMLIFSHSCMLMLSLRKSFLIIPCCSLILILNARCTSLQYAAVEPIYKLLGGDPAVGQKLSQVIMVCCILMVV